MFLAIFACNYWAASAHATVLSASVLYTNTYNATTNNHHSLRGLALSPDGSQVYAGLILPASTGGEILEINTGNGNLTNSVSTVNGNFNQPKGIAVDASGNVYTTLNDGVNTSATQKFQVLSSSLGAVSGVITAPAAGGNAQLAGADVATVSGNVYLYLTFNKGAGVIERYKLSGTGSPAAPVLDTAFGTGGLLDVRSAFNNNALTSVTLNGIAVASDGTIYGAADASTDANIRGDTVYKISSDLSTITTTSVTEAMDVALYNGNIYATEYNSTASAVAVLKQSDLSSVDTITFTGPPLHADTSTDSGFSGIDISSTGTMYVSDQLFDLTGANDQIIVATVPEPASLTLAVFGLGGLGLAARQLRKRRS
jgi:hypothetical protein